jgi:hypothetical protein
MTDKEDLIARLRNTASKGISVWGDLMLEAAKEIETLKAERECYASSMDRMLSSQRTEQEPAAQYSDIVSDGGLDPRNKFDASPQRKPLTDEQYFEIGQRHWLPSNKIEQIHKEIEAKFKENT